MTTPIRECFSAYVALRTEMDQWLEQSRRLDPPGPNDGGEDEANYALAWFSPLPDHRRRRCPAPLRGV